MKRLTRILLYPLFGWSLVLSLVACQKDTGQPAIPEGQQRVRIRLSDDPAVLFQEVNVDIRQVEVQVVPDSCQGSRGDDDHHDRDHHHGDDHHDDYYRCVVWDTLDIRPGIYNLLDLANGADTLLASGFTTEGKIVKIRLTLGDDNSVMIDSVRYPLALWNSAHQVNISVRGEDVSQIAPNDLQLWLDFDAGRSVVRVHDNKFVLKPCLRIFLPASTASIKGYVLPPEAHAVVAAIFNGDTLVAIPERRDGRFKIRGISSTTADLFINATANGYQDTTITGLSLTIGRETDIGKVELHQ